MSEFPYIFFNQTPEDLRRIGARGGKATARNRRTRLLAEPLLPPLEIVTELSAETAAEAIATLDAQFPWLRGAEKRTRPQA